MLRCRVTFRWGSFVNPCMRGVGFCCVMALVLFVGVASRTSAQAPPDMFKEVPISDRSYEVAQRLQESRTIVGYPARYFDGRRSLTRYEFAVAAGSALRKLRAWLRPQVPNTRQVRAADLPAAESLKDLTWLVEEYRKETEYVGSGTNGTNPNSLPAVYALIDEASRIKRGIPQTFIDVPKNHWAYGGVEALREQGIMIGYPSYTHARIRPIRPMTQEDRSAEIERVFRTLAGPLPLKFRGVNVILDFPD